MPIVSARPESGFTLLEMIVVLVVLGLMASLIVIRGPPSSALLDLHGTAGEVAQELRGARAQAIASDRRVVVRIDAAAHTLRVDDAPPRLLPASLGLRVVAVSQEVAAPRTARITFAPDGSSSGGTIDLVAETRRMRVAVDWLTGRVGLADLPAEAK